MKYIEERTNGQIFSIKDKMYVLTADFKTQKDKQKHCCVSLDNGQVSWKNADTMVESPSVFYQDEENNLKEIKHNEPNNNLS